MDKYRKKMMKHNADSIIFESGHYHYFNSHKTFICDESLGWRPRADMYESGEELVVVVDLPFIDQCKLEFSFGNDCIIIRGLRDQIGCDKKRHYHKMEIDFGPFERHINLPVKIDIETIKQSYKKGFLIITASKQKNIKEEI